MKSLIFLAKTIFLFILATVCGLPKLDASQSCDPKEFSEALLFLSDYENCLIGSELACRAVADFVWTLHSTGLGAASGLGGHYLGRRISQVNPKYITKKILEQNYRDATVVLVGDETVDDLVKKKGGDIQAAQSEVKALVAALEPVPNPRPEQIQQLAHLKSLESKLQNRQKLTSANNALLNNTTERVARSNQHLMAQIKKIDGELEKVTQTQQQKRSLDPGKLRAKTTELKKMKQFLFEKFVRIETDTREVALAYNQSIDRLIVDLEKQPRTDFNRQSLASLKERKFAKLPNNPIKPHSRLVQVPGEANLALVDVTNADRSQLPKAALRLREAQAEFIPQRIRYWLRQDPQLGINTTDLIERVAIDEHERYRDFTRNLLSEVADEWQKVDMLGQIDVDPKNVSEFELNQMKTKLKLQPLKTRYQNKPEALRTLLTKEKTNWAEVDVPFSELSSSNKYYTTSSIDTTLRYIDNKFVAGQAIQPGRRFLYKTYPIVGRALQQVAKDGVGKGVAGLALWYDWHDLSEMGLKLAFQSDWIRDKFQDSISLQCRMPLERKINSPDARGQVSRYFCDCKEDVVPVDHSICRFLPAQIADDARLKKIQPYCAAARRPGRDRDLIMAQGLRQLKNESLSEADKKSIKEMFQQSSSCKVMTNQPANCRIPSEEVTEQGLYYLSVIRQNQLEKEVAELCPNVCEHWTNLAKAKLKIEKELKTVEKLPRDLKANKAAVQCDSAKIREAPPQEKNRVLPSESFLSALTQWQKCQTPIVCQDNKIRINIEPHRRYEILLHPQTRQPQFVAHYFLNNFGMHSDIKSHEFEMNPNGSLEKVKIFDLEPPNNLKDEIESANLADFFGDKAFETKTDHNFGLGPKRSDYSMARRLEMFMATYKAIDFCCTHQQIDCQNWQKDSLYQDYLEHGAQ